MQLEEDGAEKIKIPYKQSTSWQGRNPRAPNGSEMSAFITGTLPLQRKEEVVQDGTDSWMLYWSFVCNTTNTLFIPILLNATEFIWQKYQQYSPSIFPGNTAWFKGTSFLFSKVK